MFCIIKESESLGFAKVLEATGNTWTVEYFDNPTPSGRETRKVAKSQIIKKILGPNTRVYYNHEATGQWHVGRIIHDDGEGVEIRFPNRTDRFIQHDYVFVRCKKPIRDPVEFLSHAITETPSYAESRSRFLASYIAQRGATGGLAALLSSAIELNPHQIDVVRRVLGDPSQRYLLADEVGLGKTIEAGVIIRQAALDDPKGHKIAIIAPKPLIRQWRAELINRFGLAAYLDISVFVVPDEISRDLTSALAGATMLVVDEAHHLASPDLKDMVALYERICQAAHSVERLLLLSATPVLRNEAGFLRMLHLLEPAVYDLSNLEAFRAKIKHRQSLAEAVAALDPQNALQLAPVLDDLLAILPGDQRLQTLIEDLRKQLVDIPDPEDPNLKQAIRLLRAHLSETYRLHRRILRNRRKNVNWLTPNRSGSEICQVPQVVGWGRVESALESWRMSAVASISALTQKGLGTTNLTDFYWDAVCALLENPGQIARLCKDRTARLRASAQSEAGFEGETELLNTIIRLSGDYESYLQARIEALSEQIKGLVRKRYKVVVFCSIPEVADQVFSDLKRSTIPNTTVRHEVVEVDEFASGEVAWMRFNSSPDVQTIVCDRRAEEGVNLQGGRKAIIHFDLPINPNRIEQRIGRLDRYGTGDPVRSIVVLDEGTLLQRTWYSVLKEGLGVFDRSISSLQYLVENQLQELRGNLLLDGSEAFTKLASKLGGRDGMVVREWQLIDQQDGLDELAPQLETDLDSISDVDDTWQEIRDTTQTWVVDTLQFEQVLVPRRAAGDAGVDPPFRYKYLLPGGNGRATLIPLSGFLDDFLGALDFEARNASSRRPLSYIHSYHRKTAIKFGVRPLRYGCEFMEAIRCFSDLDDRGRSFAIWRRLRRGVPANSPSMYFRFDFLVECNLDVGKALLESMSLPNGRWSIASISRRTDALFPPFVASVWIDEDGNEPNASFVDTFLASRYDKNGATGRYIDTNLRTRRLQYLIANVPDKFGNWTEHCGRMRDRAIAVLNGRRELAAKIDGAIANARLRDEICFAQIATRIQHVSDQEADIERRHLDFEEKLSLALSKGMTEPTIRVDVAGMVFLSAKDFSMPDSIPEVVV